MIEDKNLIIKLLSECSLLNELNYENIFSAMPKFNIEHTDFDADSLIKIWNHMKNQESLDFLSKYGGINSLYLLNNIFPNEFRLYFFLKSFELLLSSNGSKFQKLMKTIFGINIALDTLKKHPDLLYLYEIYKYNSDYINSPEHREIIHFYYNGLDEFKTINKKYKIEYYGLSENKLSVIYLINNVHVSFAVKNKVFKNKINCKTLYSLCLDLENILTLEETLIDKIEEFGSNAIFRILKIINYDGLIDYFEKIILLQLSQRQLPSPYKIIKKYGLTNTYTDNTLKDVLLNKMEETILSHHLYLIDGNYDELLKNDKWTIFYNLQNHLRYSVLNFSDVENPFLRDEIITFLRIYIKETGNFKNIHNIFRSLRRCCNYLDNCNSVVEITNAQFQLIKNKLSNDLHDSTALKSLKAMHLFFWVIFQKKIDTGEIKYGFYNYVNPFKSIAIDIDSSVVKPLSRDVISTIMNNIDFLPNYIKIAMLLLFATGARPDEICDLKVNDLEINNDKKIAILNRRLIKNAKSNLHKSVVRCSIPINLAYSISEYIKETQHIREKLNTDIIFVFHDRRHRESGLLQYKFLTASILQTQLKKFNKKLGFYERNFITSRSIRATTARELFRIGYDENEVSDFLGNTPKISKLHYNYISPDEKLVITSNWAEKEFSNIHSFNDYFINFDNHSKEISVVNTNNPSLKPFVLLYGQCIDYNDNCSKIRNCDTCELVITCKKRRLGQC